MIKLFSGFGDSNEKELKRLQPLVDRVNELEPDFEKLSDEELGAKTEEFRARLKDGATLDELLPEAFAAVREVAKRTLGQRHYDVQLLGGIVLHQGKIAEMKTGEGKTLVATLPLYLNSLAGKGCHLVTVNDYLARRDPYWMGPVYHALGVSVASIYPMQSPDEHTPARLYDPDYDSGKELDPWRHFRPIPRGEAYRADITYGTSSEFGFDYLRDNMVIDLRSRVQKELNYAIVDEVDNLLIDEARTPLIISGPDEEAGKLYPIFAQLVPRLRPEADYEIDAKTRTATLTEDGMSNMERTLAKSGLLKSPSLYDPSNHSLIRHLESALKAHALYKKDVDYVVKDGQVIIVDQFTGRLMVGRRYSEGLHQAIEAKERVVVQRETKTYATITIQNYFRMYHKLAGMTGTAVTEAEEFHKIYELEVLVIPTNKPMMRQDYSDLIYKDEEAKFKAVVREIDEFHQQGRPIIVGTVSIEKSEDLSGRLTRKGIAHQVLNAKLHEKEAGIISDAGKPGAVTVATNMAGRGVDIVLGGKEPPRENKKEWQEWQKRHSQVIEAGGLHVLATERHEARRIDNQLRGRSGRQGDPGSTRFYVSLEDDIVKRFGGERIKGFMERLGLDEDTPIENRFINKTIEDVQKRVEGYHFDVRKHLVEYDDVVNTHRELIYEERRKILGNADLKANILAMVAREIQSAVATYLPEDRSDEWDVVGLVREVGAIMPLPPELTADTLAKMEPGEVEAKLIEHSEALYEAREQEMGSENVRVMERLVLLRILDSLWIEHLTAMEDRRREAGWQSLRQVRSIDAYRSVGFEQFEELKTTYQHDVAHAIYHVTIKKKEAPPKQVETPMAQVSPGKASGPKKPPPKVADGKVVGKVGRNDPCPCGSGKKYKKCCGR
ncbi:MAG: preprotein translocase subunit SecA [Dehalococcoidales bacterium]|nr:preprotein translocase subunit SecA [Dehalococcoidales bacterium]